MYGHMHIIAYVCGISFKMQQRTYRYIFNQKTWFDKMFRKCVLESMDEVTFLSDWEQMIQMYNLADMCVVTKFICRQREVGIGIWKTILLCMYDKHTKS